MINRIALASLASALVWFWWGAITGAAAWLALSLAVAFRNSSKQRLVAASAASVVTAFGVHAWFPGFRAGSVLASLAGQGVFDRRTEIETVRRFDAFLYARSRQVAEEMRQRRPPVRSIATIGIGALGWHLDCRIIDLLGLVDAHVARSRLTSDHALAAPGHQRGDADYVLGLQPDYLFIPPPNSGPAFPIHYALWRHPKFLADYVWDPTVPAYRRREHERPP